MSVSRNAPSPGEPYVTIERLSAHMGVSESTIKRWVAAGAPSETWGLKRTRRFLVSEVIGWARERGDASTVVSDNQPASRVTAPEAGQPKE